MKAAGAQGGFPDEDLVRFQILAQSATFILSEKAADFVNLCEERVRTLLNVEDVIKEEKPGDERREAHQERLEIRQWLRGLRPDLDEAFAQDLTLREY